MRNIQRVVLWGLPPSFCALVQRAGRAARDMTTFGEAILIVPAKLIKDGLTQEEVAGTLEESAQAAEAENGETGGQDMLASAASADGVQIHDGDSTVLVTEGGFRLETNADEEEEEDEHIAGSHEKGQSKRGNRRKKRGAECNVLEARFLTEYTITSWCRRDIWDRFFKNHKKRESTVTSGLRQSLSSMGNSPSRHVY